MKYLEKYDIFEAYNINIQNVKDILLSQTSFRKRLSTHELLQDLKDICLELQDDNFTVNIEKESDKSDVLDEDDMIAIRISNDKREYFTFAGDVRDVVCRINQHVLECGYRLNIYINTNTKIYIKSDDNIRTQSLVNVDENWPRIFNITIKIYDPRRYKLLNVL